MRQQCEQKKDSLPKMFTSLLTKRRHWHLARYLSFSCACNLPNGLENINALMKWYGRLTPPIPLYFNTGTGMPARQHALHAESVPNSLTDFQPIAIARYKAMRAEPNKPIDASSEAKMKQE
ncbi:MAG TPA: hypothetical protein ENJ88_06425 [Phaeodactylibacter sp.]|nr:hypothetical protein [Phaeodactylibacter sp.]